MDAKLFIDKYKPTCLETAQINEQAVTQLLAFATSKEVPHIILRGPTGSGKKTLAILYVKAKYPEMDLVRIRQQTLEIRHVSKTLELHIHYSNYHYQLDPSVHGVYDRLIVQGFLKDLLQSKPICQTPYHLIIIENAEKMTQEAQQSLRRTLEKNMVNCRFVFLVNQESTLIEPLMSRCIQIRLASPTISQIINILNEICECEKIDTIPSILEQIAIYTERNLTTAINTLQYLSTVAPEVLKLDRKIDFKQYFSVDQYLNQIVHLMITRSDPTIVESIRTLLYDLLVHCVDPIDIVKQLYQLLLPHVNPAKQHQLIKIVFNYENTLQHGSKPIYHLEGLVIAVMNLF